ncbi:hypothetical protein CORC01_12208 [Colletotrichum orchidophilum]|uniref:Uncharacterized protein n=1 Tax=Colletotrichum orchidophilum TaxID=1209926 RepID=A0A1G4ATJ2_9PEZI|nr:uncharacterized protein CORC01_12208 [Colletotrichum orchidophilum]OHE92490.1 hypothetical protein CORC01_12208 [Colletotrichum orchidophilum]
MENSLSSLVPEDFRLLAVSAGGGEESIRHPLAQDSSVPRERADDVRNPASALMPDDIASLAASRRLLGGNLLKNDYLVDIVSKVLIAPPRSTWDKCLISEDIRDFYLKPHQIIGKTITTLFTLGETIAQHKAKNRENGDAVYLPSGISMPASVLD